MDVPGLRLKQAAVMDQIFRVLYWGPVTVYVVIGMLLLGPIAFWKDFTESPLWWLGLLAAIFVLHEALHALGYMSAGARPQSIRFTVDKPNLSIECGCSDPISLHGLRVATLLPFAVLTPLLLGLALVVQELGAWTVLAISVSACAYDLTVAVAISSVPGSTRVIPELHTRNGIVFIRLANA